MQVQRLGSGVEPLPQLKTRAQVGQEADLPKDGYFPQSLSGPAVSPQDSAVRESPVQGDPKTGPQAEGAKARTSSVSSNPNGPLLILEEHPPLEAVSHPLPVKSPCRDTIDDLATFLDTAREQGVKEHTAVNASRPDLFESKVEGLWKTLNSEEMQQKVKSDPYLVPLLKQTVTNLKHIRLDFVRRDENYVHQDVLPGPYPFEPTLNVLRDVRNFYRVLDGSEASEVKASASPGEVQKEIQTLEDQQKTMIKGIINDPMTYYQDFKARLQKDGPAASFPEFKDLVRYMDLHMDKEGPLAEASSDKHLAVARKIAKEALAKVQDEGYPYRETIEAVQQSLGFLDTYERGRPGSEARPDLYHAHRYGYYSHFIKAETPDHVLFPTFYGLGATDLLKTRGVPIGFVGTPPEVSWVDGYSQTPLEFFNHDINHVRRMWQFTKEHAQEMGVPLQDFITESNRYVKEDLMPLIKIDKSETPEQKNEKRMMKLILFEALHEDALPAHPEVLRRSLMRAPNTLTPFEELIDDGKRVRYLMEPGATTTAYVYRKAAGMFYDMPSMRMENIVGVNYRTQDFVAESAKTLSRKLNLGVPDDLIDSYTRDDTGMPDDFRFQLEQQLEEDPDRMAPLNMKEDPALADKRRG